MREQAVRASAGPCGWGRGRHGSVTTAACSISQRPCLGGGCTRPETSGSLRAGRELGVHAHHRRGPPATRWLLLLGMASGSRAKLQGGCSAFLLPTLFSQCLLPLVVIATELYQNATLADGQATPEYSLGFHRPGAGQASSLLEREPTHQSLPGARSTPRGQSDSYMPRSRRGALGSRACKGGALQRRAGSPAGRRGRKTRTCQASPAPRQRLRNRPLC